jgi:hypothetical protein
MCKWWLVNENNGQVLGKAESRKEARVKSEKFKKQGIPIKKRKHMPENNGQ